MVAIEEAEFAQAGVPSKQVVIIMAEIVCFESTTRKLDMLRTNVTNYMVIQKIILMGVIRVTELKLIEVHSTHNFLIQTTKEKRLLLMLVESHMT